MNKKGALRSIAGFKTPASSPVKQKWRSQENAISGLHFTVQTQSLGNLSTSAYVIDLVTLPIHPNCLTLNVTAEGGERRSLTHKECYR